MAYGYSLVLICSNGYKVKIEMSKIKWKSKLITLTDWIIHPKLLLTECMNIIWIFKWVNCTIIQEQVFILILLWYIDCMWIFLSDINGIVIVG